MSSNQFQPTGWHYLLDLFDCSPDRINDLEFVLDCLRQAAERANATVVDTLSHQFRPTGVTAVALLKESHLSIHCWPESGYVAVDLFSCGENGDPRAACDYLVERFSSTRYQLKTVKRGLSINKPE